jgi:hypothetical protein
VSAKWLGSFEEEKNRLEGAAVVKIGFHDGSGFAVYDCAVTMMFGLGLVKIRLA